MPRVSPTPCSRLPLHTPHTRGGPALDPSIRVAITGLRRVPAPTLKAVKARASGERAWGGSPWNLPPSQVESLLRGLPRSLRDALLPFQLEGVRYGVSRGGRCLIGDEMGIGKTIQSIAIAACYLPEWPLLVVSPSSMRIPWADELERWLPFLRPGDVHLVEASVDQIPPGAPLPRVVVISYRMLAILGERITRRGWGVVIVDECHNLRCSTRKPTDEVRYMVDVIQRTRRAILLSGTPSLTRPFDLFYEIDSLRPGLLGSNKFAFAKAYCNWRPGGEYKSMTVSGGTHLNELHVLLRETVMIRRRKCEVMSQLPPKRRQAVQLVLASRIVASSKSQLQGQGECRQPDRGRLPAEGRPNEGSALPGSKRREETASAWHWEEACQGDADEEGAEDWGDAAGEGMWGEGAHEDGGGAWADASMAGGDGGSEHGPTGGGCDPALSGKDHRGLPGEGAALGWVAGTGLRTAWAAPLPQRDGEGGNARMLATGECAVTGACAWGNGKVDPWDLSTGHRHTGGSRVEDGHRGGKDHSGKDHDPGNGHFTGSDARNNTRGRPRGVMGELMRLSEAKRPAVLEWLREMLTADQQGEKDGNNEPGNEPESDHVGHYSSESDHAGSDGVDAERGGPTDARADSGHRMASGSGPLRAPGATGRATPGATGHVPKTLIFGHYADMLDAVQALLEELGVAFVRIDGRVPPGVRNERVRAFNAPTPPSSPRRAHLVASPGSNPPAGTHPGPGRGHASAVAPSPVADITRPPPGPAHHEAHPRGRASGAATAGPSRAPSGLNNARKNTKHASSTGGAGPRPNPHPPPPSVRVALVSITAGGVGLDLHAATRVVFTELYPDVAQMMQAEDRAHRRGAGGSSSNGNNDASSNNTSRNNGSSTGNSNKMADPGIDNSSNTCPGADADSMGGTGYGRQHTVPSINIYYLVGLRSFDEVLWGKLCMQCGLAARTVDGDQGHAGRTLEVENPGDSPWQAGRSRGAGARHQHSTPHTREVHGGDMVGGDIAGTCHGVRDGDGDGDGAAATNGVGMRSGNGGGGVAGVGGARGGLGGGLGSGTGREKGGVVEAGAGVRADTSTGGGRGGRSAGSLAMVAVGPGAEDATGGMQEDATGGMQEDATGGGMPERWSIMADGVTHVCAGTTNHGAPRLGDASSCDDRVDNIAGSDDLDDGDSLDLLFEVSKHSGRVHVYRAFYPPPPTTTTASQPSQPAIMEQEEQEPPTTGEYEPLWSQRERETAKERDTNAGGERRPMPLLLVQPLQVNFRPEQLLASGGRGVAPSHLAHLPHLLRVSDNARLCAAGFLAEWAALRPVERRMLQEAGRPLPPTGLLAEVSAETRRIKAQAGWGSRPTQEGSTDGQGEGEATMHGDAAGASLLTRQGAKSGPSATPASLVCGPRGNAACAGSRFAPMPGVADASFRRYTPAVEVLPSLPPGGYVQEVRWWLGGKSTRGPEWRPPNVTLAPFSADGHPLCKLCHSARLYGASEPRTGVDFFCSVACHARYGSLSSRGGAFLRRQLFEIERGVCVLCGLDAHSLAERVRRAPPGKEHRQALILASAPAFADWPASMARLAGSGAEGDAWHADHVRAVFRGGGECGLGNLRTLCVPCHMGVTAEQARERADESRRAKRGRAALEREQGQGVEGQDRDGTARKVKASRHAEGGREPGSLAMGSQTQKMSMGGTAAEAGAVKQGIARRWQFVRLSDIGDEEEEGGERGKPAGSSPHQKLSTDLGKQEPGCGYVGHCISTEGSPQTHRRVSFSPSYVQTHDDENGRQGWNKYSRLDVCPRPNEIAPIPTSPVALSKRASTDTSGSGNDGDSYLSDDEYLLSAGLSSMRSGQ